MINAKLNLLPLTENKQFINYLKEQKFEMLIYDSSPELIYLAEILEIPSRVTITGLGSDTTKA